MMNVIRILEEPMVAVRDAPILLKPVEYDKEPMNGINENRNKMMMVTKNGWRNEDSSSECNLILKEP